MSSAWWTVALAWQAMMTVMMAPTAYPWLRSARVLAPAAPTRAAAGFGAGYFAAWVPFSLVLAAAQLRLAHEIVGAAVWRGSLLLAAGLYQFAPLKRACLEHCRHPLGFLLERWDDRPQATLQLGLRHGWVCLGCCWALMATALVVGMDNLFWMAALAVATFAEQTLPRAGWVRPTLGLGLAAAGAAVLLS